MPKDEQQADDRQMTIVTRDQERDFWEWPESLGGTLQCCPLRVSLYHSELGFVKSPFAICCLSGELPFGTESRTTSFPAHLCTPARFPLLSLTHELLQ